MGRLRQELAPRFPQHTLEADSVVFKNLVGSFSLDNGDVVEVIPKIYDKEWTQAVIGSLSSRTRFAVTGSHRSSSQLGQQDLSYAVAHEYARRLEQALSREGPLLAYERVEEKNRRLNGRLNVRTWLKSSILDPASFPVVREELTAYNDFTRALSVAAGHLAKVAIGSELSFRLRRLQSAIMPGHHLPTNVPRSVAFRQLPSQWPSYRGAWDIAASILKNRALTGPVGDLNGFEVAVEPWPLLETQLERTLRQVTKASSGLMLGAKTRHPILKTTAGTVARKVEPDGLLLDSASNVVATFEAKYSIPEEYPARDHVFQTLATAAALRAPLAVLVYPTANREESYEVTNFGGFPQRLVTLGLSMFSYRYGVSERFHAERILNIVHRL